MLPENVPEYLIEQLVKTEQLAQAGIPRVPPPELLKEFVRLQRSLRGWKQQTLASFAQVSLSTIERIERGEPVSADSLDRVAIALGYKKGDFTDPRVPPTAEQIQRMLTESMKMFEGRIHVLVRPLRTQLHVANLARADFSIVDSERLNEEYESEIAGLREYIDLASFILATEEKGSIIQCASSERVKRRELYSRILDLVRNIELRSSSVALAGTYQAKTEAEIMPTVTVSVVGFFPKSSDPAAIKRKILLVPARIDLAAAWERFCHEGP